METKLFTYVQMMNNFITSMKVNPAFLFTTILIFLDIISD